LRNNGNLMARRRRARSPPHYMRFRTCGSARLSSHLKLGVTYVPV
jgi:hypothetical protein